MSPRLARLSEGGNVPAMIVGIVALLLLLGIGIIVQNEAAYRDLQEQETRVQAEILAASVNAALDFGDAAAAQEAVNAIRVNRRVRTVGIYNAQGRLIAGYGRDGASPGEMLSDRQGGGSVNISTVPVESGSARIGSVHLAIDREPLTRRISRYFVIVLLVLMAVIVVAVLGHAQAALRRINRELEARADALVQANAELKVQIGERAKAQDELRQAQKLQALGQLTGGIAHDFNNLLTVIQGSADMLRRPGVADDKRIRFAEAIVQAASRAAALTGQLLAFARRQPLQPEIIDVNALISGMSDLLDRTLGERIKVTTRLANLACAVEVDRAQLEAALLNIAVNARDAMPDGGSLTIETALRSGEDDQEMIAIAVRDTGLGMDADTLNRAIEPFFTTKGAGKGTGLGLSQVYGFAAQSGGDVRIDSGLGKGTTVTLLLPSSRAPGETEGQEQADRLVAGRSGRILLVEDNEEVGEFAETLMSELGHQVVRVQSGAEALQALQQDGFDTVFTDVVMPGMSGLELAEAIDKLWPGLPVILSTGYSDEIADAGTGGRPVILKPYRIETLAGALDEALASREG